MKLHIAVAQFAPSTDKERNLQRIDHLVRESVSQGARLVVLPEYATFTNNVIDESFVRSAEPLSGDSVTVLRQLSSELDVALICGVNEPDGNGRIYNTLVGIDGGEIVATYRKMHLYDAFGVKESKWVTPGDIGEPEILTIDGFRIGMQTCYDLRFPEVSRALVDAGANVLALPAEWVPGPLKEFHWTALLRARAIENTVYVVAADQCAPTGVGHSAIVDPMGISIAMIADGEGLAHETIRDERIKEVRRTNPALEVRRFKVTSRT
ncbi:MAG: carbon-nitrogen hydrolase family protein [Micrococcaceae bacterium]